MKINYLRETPRKLKEFPVENELNLSEQEVTDVAEIFSTPLTGSYNWDYTVQDNRIKKLYELGKELNWTVEKDIDWNRPLPEREETPPEIFWDQYEPYQKLSNEGSNVSAQYLISQKGKIFNLLCPKYKAWHAGKSKWRNNTNINEYFIYATNVGYD